MSFSTILKLQKYLTRENLSLLEMVLRGLTSPTEKDEHNEIHMNEAFHAFWSWFGKQDGVNTSHVEHAVRSLGELRRILRDYMTGRG
jgi:hypothetical protein